MNNEQEIDGLSALGGAFASCGATIGLFVWSVSLLILGIPKVTDLVSRIDEHNRRPKITETGDGRVVVRLDNLAGTDFDRDGVLDEVHKYIGGGRVGYVVRSQLQDKDVEYERIQESYSNSLKPTR